MAGEEDAEVVVKIEPEAPVVDQSKDAVVKAGEGDAKVKDPAVADLVTQYKELEAESERRKVAQQEANKRAADSAAEAARARQEAAAAKAQATDSNLDAISTALSSAQADIESAKRDIKNAIESGDAQAQADAYDRLATARSLALRYDESKADLEARKAAKPELAARPSDPVEAYIQGRTEPTANWLREHRDFVTDPRKNNKLTGAHYDAVGEGLTPDTAEYFEHVEKVLGLRKADPVVTDGDQVQRPGAKKPAARVAAPVNGSAGTGGAVGGNEVRLSQREATAATDGTVVWNYDDPSPQKRFKKGDAIGVQEFARRKMKLTEQGAYDRTYETQ